MRSNSTQFLKGIALLMAGSLQALAAVSSEQAARLGAELTPMGAEVAANADSSIPAWNGGITTAPAGYTPGLHHPDPFSGDSVKFTITGANADQYREMLSPGHLALLAAYPTYKMPVYPTRRSASNPQAVYDATKANATSATLESDGNTVQNAIGGIPFPIPQDGPEAIWNHIMRFRGIAALRLTTQAAPTRGGSYTLVKFKEEFLFNYFMPGMTAAALDNVAFYFKQEVTEPARLAGSILIVHETIDQVKEPRRAWVYNVGQRRVRRAPNVAFDNPGTAADGMRTSDQLDMFNGAINRYTWELKGKKEMIMPYNSYKLHSNSLKYSDILKPLHINQDLTRYELHRVWVVEANLKPGTSHIYPRRVFYIDEDSWQILAVDHYDARGQLWRISEAHCINYYDQLTFWSTVEVHTDLLAGRYIALGLDNEEKMYDFTVKRTPQDYTPASLRMDGIR
jgi:hypothetical protein